MPARGYQVHFWSAEGKLLDNANVLEGIKSLAVLGLYHGTV